MNRVDINTELVIDMYVNQGMSLTKIGEIFDVTRNTIRERLKEKNITIKSSAQVDIEKMVDMYVNQKMSSAKIGEIMEVTKQTILNKLKELGVKIRTREENQTIEVDILRLEDMYVNQKMSSYKIGEIMGVNGRTILNKLKILGIPRRSKSEAVALNHTQKKKDYSRNNMSTRNIVDRGSSCIEHQHFSGGPNLGNQTPIRKRLGGNSPNPTTI